MSNYFAILSKDIVFELCLYLSLKQIEDIKNLTSIISTFDESKYFYQRKINKDFPLFLLDFSIFDKLSNTTNKTYKDLYVYCQNFKSGYANTHIIPTTIINYKNYTPYPTPYKDATKYWPEVQNMISAYRFDDIACYIKENHIRHGDFIMFECLIHEDIDHIFLYDATRLGFTFLCGSNRNINPCEKYHCMDEFSIDYWADSSKYIDGFYINISEYRKQIEQNLRYLGNTDTSCYGLNIYISSILHWSSGVYDVIIVTCDILTVNSHIKFNKFDDDYIFSWYIYESLLYEKLHTKYQTLIGTTMNTETTMIFIQSLIRI